MIQLRVLCPREEKKKKENPTRNIKETPTLHNSMLFFSPGRTIPAIPWLVCCAPKAIPVRGFPLTCGPIQTPTSMMRDSAYLQDSNSHVRPEGSYADVTLDTSGCVYKSLFFLSYVHILSL